MLSLSKTLEALILMTGGVQSKKSYAEIPEVHKSKLC